MHQGCTCFGGLGYCREEVGGMRKRSEITDRLTVGQPAYRVKQVKSAVRQLKTPAEVLQALQAVLNQAKVIGMNVIEKTDELGVLIVTITNTKEG